MSKKNSFEESRRVWSGTGFIKYKHCPTQLMNEQKDKILRKMFPFNDRKIFESRKIVGTGVLNQISTFNTPTFTYKVTSKNLKKL